jgi:hypothetical protein
VFGGIIPFDIYACHFIPHHADLHTVVLLEKIEEMVEVFNSDVFDAKVVNDQAKLDGTLCVCVCVCVSDLQ